MSGDENLTGVFDGAKRTPEPLVVGDDLLPSVHGRPAPPLLHPVSPERGRGDQHRHADGKQRHLDTSRPPAASRLLLQAPHLPGFGGSTRCLRSSQYSPPTSPPVRPQRPPPPLPTDAAAHPESSAALARHTHQPSLWIWMEVGGVKEPHAVATDGGGPAAVAAACPSGDQLTTTGFASSSPRRRPR
uniref:Uncharacterized protein n=1 Tax=Oryza meridionalis TaxID=40149 RepID=A0A0E0EMC8_9ORYZ